MIMLLLDYNADSLQTCSSLLPVEFAILESNYNTALSLMEAMQERYQLANKPLSFDYVQLVITLPPELQGTATVTWKSLDDLLQVTKLQEACVCPSVDGYQAVDCISLGLDIRLNASTHSPVLQLDFQLNNTNSSSSGEIASKVATFSTPELYSLRMIAMELMLLSILLIVFIEFRMK